MNKNFTPEAIVESAKGTGNDLIDLGVGGTTLILEKGAQIIGGILRTGQKGIHNLAQVGPIQKRAQKVRGWVKTAMQDPEYVPTAEDIAAAKAYVKEMEARAKATK